MLCLRGNKQSHERRHLRRSHTTWLHHFQNLYTTVRRKRETAAAYERADIAFYELLSHDLIDIEERHYNRLHYSLRVTEENCLEDRIMILHLFEKANQLHTATVRVGICTPTSDSTEATRTAIFESFMP